MVRLDAMILRNYSLNAKGPQFVYYEYQNKNRSVNITVTEIHPNIVEKPKYFFRKKLTANKQKFICLNIRASLTELPSAQCIKQQPKNCFCILLSIWQKLSLRSQVLINRTID